MIGPKSTVSGVHVYQGIAFIALLATIYVSTPPEPRWKVMAIAGVVGIIVAVAASRLYHAARPGSRSVLADRRGGSGQAEALDAPAQHDA